VLTKNEILRLFDLLNARLSRRGIKGEIYLVGGAVMCLVFNARPSTKDIDAYFAPARPLREAATEIAEEEQIGSDWLNDAVKGFLSERPSFSSYLELSHLKVFAAQPDYLLAMKCMAMRLGAEFFDESDIRYLLRYLNVVTYEQAIGIIAKYYPLEAFPQKTLYALEEILS
jgi:hypothetical protein